LPVTKSRFRAPATTEKGARTADRRTTRQTAEFVAVSAEPGVLNVTLAPDESHSSKLRNELMMHDRDADVPWGRMRLGMFFSRVA
jgi:hypothetical protein